MKTKKIQLKDLVVGMKIKTLDANKNVVFKTVTDIWETEVCIDDQRTLIFDNKTELNCSKNHPIMIEKDNMQFTVLPDNLLFSDKILTDNNHTKIISVSKGNTSINYIDITVEDTHTFFAANSPESEMVLTHNSQGGVRGGAATLYYPIWHLEAEELLVLKNNKGTEDNRIRHLDYGVQFNKVMYERLINGGNITLFSPHDVPELYEAFFVDSNKFRELYERAERNPKLRKKQVPAIDMFSSFVQERKDTGRVYLMNVDHCNDHGSFLSEVAPIRQSNLCAEITLPTKPLNDLKDGSPIVKVMKLTKEEYKKYLEWKKSNPNTPIKSKKIRI